MLAQVADLGQKEGKDKDKKLKELLNKSFLVVKTKALRPVVMAVMKHLSHVDEKYLKVLVILQFSFHFYDKSDNKEFVILGERQGTL